VPWFLGERVFILSAIMMGMAVIIGAIIFLQYVILAQRLNSVFLPESVFDRQTLQKIIGARQDREEAFKAAGLKDYPDSFSPKSE
ncbi:MAG: hypothetical protein Q8N56_03900, partial [bacterium]|nr:hypothetical protein [bacterium]